MSIHVQVARTLAISTLCFAFTTESSGQKKATEAAGADHATMIIMAPSGPVFADVRISVAKIPYRTWVGKFLATQLDRDKNGRLEAKELELLTDNIRRLSAISGPDEILSAMNAERTSPEKVTASDVGIKEFADWLSQRLPKVFDLIAQPQSSDDAVRLASLIDNNQNAAISDEELLAAFRTLRFRDLDNDETFSVSELLPYRDPRSLNASVTPDAVNLPFFHLTDAASIRLAAERIAQRYGQDRTMTAALLRSDTSQLLDETLNVTAIEGLLSDLSTPDFHLMVDVRLSDRANTSDIDLSIMPSATAFCRITDDSFGQTTIVIDGLPLKIVARGGGANNRAVTRGFLGQTFVMIDNDRNQYLDEMEFIGIVAAMQQSGATGSFSDVDQNDDKMLTREEVFSFVEQNLTAAASRIEVTVQQDGKTLFGLLDSNADRRLSAREVRTGTNVLKKYDLNGDGIFAETELGTEYLLTFGLGRSELRRSNGGMQMGTMQMGSGDAILPGVSGLTGPEWFRRMDRNQDGDVSSREFLSSPQHFRTLDVDQDLLISSAEAEALK